MYHIKSHNKKLQITGCIIYYDIIQYSDLAFLTFDILYVCEHIHASILAIAT